MRNFYSVSISGYHIAEAGANPISQLAFTLANGFTYVEAYLARGHERSTTSPPTSRFFFSNGMDPEYTVLGRVARRIWAVAMRDRYGADERSQKLKYHVQTSGRSLHAQEMAFNDIRTTLQALCAIYDNANSLHTNAYDEAVTTPTAESVRRALAIQMVINREWGLAMNENPLQGIFIVEELTDLVEEAVLAELERISERGGVLGAMETGYQRGRIQDESMLYEHRKHDGTLPIVGVNTFRSPTADADAEPPVIELARSDDAEKQDQLDRLRDFQAAPRRRAARRPRPPARRGARRRQPLRGAHGRGALLQPRRDHPDAVRGRRSLPPQRLTRSQAPGTRHDRLPGPHRRRPRRPRRGGARLPARPRRLRPRRPRHGDDAGRGVRPLRRRGHRPHRCIGDRGRQHLRPGHVRGHHAGGLRQGLRPLRRVGLGRARVPPGARRRRPAPGRRPGPAGDDDVGQHGAVAEPGADPERDRGADRSSAPPTSSSASCPTC